MNAPRETAFEKELATFRRTWRRGLLCRGGLALATVLMLLIILGALADRWFALSMSARWGWQILTGILLLGGAIIGLTRLRRFDTKAAARTADGATNRSRQVIQAGLELLPQQDGGAPLQSYLTQRAIDEAAASLQEVPVVARRPRAAIWRQAYWLGGILLLGIVLALIHLPATTHILARLWNPGADLPPYSPLQFTITPSQPSVIYGDDLLLQTEISGGTVTDDARFLVKDLRSGRVEERASFREPGQRYAQRLENVVNPVAIAFGVGRARSPWHTVEVRLEPRVTAAEVRITPPAYTGQPTIAFSLGEGECKAITGSQIDVTLTSNRPVGGGSLTLLPKQPLNKEVLPIVGTIESTHRIRFTWALTDSALAQFTLEDILGTPLAKPLEIDQIAMPDVPPVATITSPESRILATPNSEIPFAAEIEDDLGLTKTSWIRSLAGYRDRSRLMAQGKLGKRHEMEETVALAPLGAEPGQTLEFVVEGMDENPTLMGIGTSDPVQIQIISQDDYAELIRLRTTLDEFTARYDALAQALEKARAGLEAVESAQFPHDALKEAMKVHEEAAKTFDSVAKDFQAFDSEAALSEMAQETAQKLREQLRNMDQLTRAPDPLVVRREARALREALGGAQEAMDAEMEKADQFKAVGRVMEMAATFQKILRDQESLAKRTEAIAKEVSQGIMANVPQLGALARVQRENREALEAFTKELRKRAEALPQEFESLGEQALRFAETVETLDVAPAMGMAAQRADAGDSYEAASNAALALQLLQRVLTERKQSQCQFAGMCQGGMPKFEIPQDMTATMEQLLKAMLGRLGKPGGGEGQQPGQAGGSGGMGLGLAGSDGRYMPGFHQLRLPMFGPARLRFQAPAPGMGNRSGRGGQGGRGSGGSAATVENERATLEALRHQETGQSGAEAVPERYREAVKRYFSNEDVDSPSDKR